jgi:hypothetical protein
MSSTIFPCTLQKYSLTFVSNSTIIRGMKNEDYQKRPWTHKERQLLKEQYGRISMQKLLEKLPDRSENSIRKQVYYLRKRGWTF